MTHADPPGSGNLEERVASIPPRKLGLGIGIASLFVSTTLDAVLTHWNISTGLVYEMNPFMEGVASSGLPNMLAVKYATAGFLTYLCAWAQSDKRSGFFGKKLHTKYVLLGAAAYYGIGTVTNLCYMF